MSEELTARIRACSQLPSLPGVALKVLELARQPDAGVEQIAALIAKDSALTARVLKTANSSFYGRTRPVVTISQAVVTLGVQAVKTLVLGFSLVRTLSRARSRGFDHLGYWKRSVYSASAAKLLAQRMNIVQQEEAFLAALLMDIGMLALDQVLGKPYSQVIADIQGHDPLAAAESRAFGLTHADAGALLAEQWNLPPVLAEPIRHHHAADAVEDADLRQFTLLVGLAGKMADVFVDDCAASSIAEVRRRGLTDLGLTPDACDQVMDDVGRHTRSFSDLFQLRIGTQKSFEQILRRANETLVEMTLQSHAHASRMAERATELAEQAGTLAARADSLAEMNRELRAKAGTDALTGLANRGRFDGFLEDALNKARAQGRALSLLLIDLDHFKSINDTFGHAAGDEVLRRVAQVLQAHARASDLPARYGGEELAMVLPSTRRATAIELAQALRAAVAVMRVRVDGRTVPVTASFGVAGCDGNDPLPDSASELASRADAALYRAKREGRNCVRCEDPTPRAA
jgi:diguanylate cyclase (GGDEF)-like protein